MTRSKDDWEEEEKRRKGGGGGCSQKVKVQPGLAVAHMTRLCH